ncbi:NAD(+)/NADH kinase [Sporomusa malonica]|uniref:NAD kinase n=1 Tax=Sporomusa malonica TaxID=112901 RepID=A0A1W1Z9P1_9FIRM|nr:NAD(+)/NADH kinase [Sporomusa malonica]SMC45115.1 NAD+ kinase [Sporomusa malonica]
MKVGIMLNRSKGLKTSAIETVITHIERQGSSVEILDLNNPLPELDVVLSFGGDGTVLGTARYVGEIPIFGINTGHLGFLTGMEYNLPKVIEALSLILNSQFTIDKRKRLEARVYRHKRNVAQCTALNDIVVKGAIAKLVRLRTHIGGDYVGNFPADGIIISTATGSTGYSISAGGAIIPPDLGINVITPICSHLLNVRSMIACDNKEIKIVVESYHKELLLSADGQVDIELETDDCIVINKASTMTNLIRLNNETFYQLLSRKMKWDKDKKERSDLT